MMSIGVITTTVLSAVVSTRSCTESLAAPLSARSRTIARLLPSTVTAVAPGIGVSYSEIHRFRTNRGWNSGWVRRDKVGAMVHWRSRDSRM